MAAGVRVTGRKGSRCPGDGEAQPLYPMALRRVLPIGRHLCGPHCADPDPDTPVRLDWRAPDAFDRRPVRQPCGHAIAPGVAHACGPRPGRPVLFRGSG